MLTNKNLELSDTIILFDRDLGVSIFQNYKGYNNLVDDAEWLLERTSQKSRGFIIRPVRKCQKCGIWIGEYDYRGNQINRQELLFDSNTEIYCTMIENFARKRVSEKKIMEKFSLENLRKTIESSIIRDFKYYICPPNRFYHSCMQVEKIYNLLIQKYGKGKRISYSEIAKEIENAKPCEDVIVCPLRVSNLFERILNLNDAFKIRKLGELRFTSSDNIEIA
ncbi:hypothetical protein KEJ33_04395 [Candidatus Bathyarchaeota archaeon]|nr:hypothetical protein [Candidatus Bathyarchaeota archaeon]